MIVSADVNLASVNYYFRSKEALIDAVYSRRVVAITAERLRLLDEVEREAGGAPPKLERVVEAFALPMLKMALSNEQGRREAGRLISRIYSDPKRLTTGDFQQALSELAQRYTKAFRAALPGLDDQTLYWRLFFSVGALTHTMAATAILELLSGGRCDTASHHEALEQIVEFLAAGMRGGIKKKKNR